MAATVVYEGPDFIHNGNTRILFGSITVRTGATANGDVSISLLGNINVDNGTVNGDAFARVGSISITNGSWVSGEASTGLGRITIDDASVGGDVASFSGAVSIDNQSTVDGSVIAALGAVDIDRGSRVNGSVLAALGRVTVDRGSSVGGQVDVAIGNVTVDRGGSVDGSVDVNRGDVVIDRGGRVEDDVDVNRGDVLVDRGGRVEESVYVNRGDVLVDRGGMVDDFVTVDRGNVTIDRGGSVHNRVRVNTGNVLIDRSGAVYTSVRVGTGDVIVDNDATVGSWVTVTDGNVSLDNGGRIYDGVSITNTGSLTLDNSAQVWGEVYLKEGSILLDGASHIQSYDSDETVTVDLGHVEILNGSQIAANVTVLSADEADGRAILLDGQSSIEGNVRVGSGDINVLYGSHITGDSVESLRGDINLLDSVISAHVTINDGWLTVDETSSIIGRVDINNQSVLNVEGTVAGDVFLNDATASLRGGLLVSNPTIDGDLINNGRVSPGNPLKVTGTVLVTGDYTQARNGSYVADLVSLSDYDRLIVGGSANISGDLYVINRGIKPVRGQTWNLIAADSVNVVDPLALHHNFATNTMLSPTVIYTDDAVQLRIEQESFTALNGLTHNQRQIGSALNHAAGRGQLDSLFEYLNYTDKGNIPALLSRLSPEELTAIFQIGVATSQIQNINIERRLEEVRAGSHGFSANGLALKDASGASVSLESIATPDPRGGLTLAGWDGKSIVSREVVAPVYQPSRFGFFATGHGEWARLSNTSEARGQNFTSAGVTVGLDYRVSEHFVVGVNGGYTNTQSDLERDGSLDVNGGRGGLYASYFNSGAYVNLAAGGGYNSYDTVRNTVGGRAKGSTDGAEANALLGLGYDFQVGGFSVGPVASVQYTYIGLNEFNETGSDAPLHYRDQHQHSLRSTVGLKAAYAINLGSLVVRPEVRAQWKHEYLDSTPEISARFRGADEVFTVNGAKIGRDSLLLDAGASVEFTPAFSVFAYYTGELGRTNYQSNAVNGGFRVAF